MLSRAQFRHLQIARGLTSEQIVQRTGIFPQSLMVLLGAAGGEGEILDYTKLLSERTLSKVLNLIGIDSSGASLNKGAVIEWSCANPRGREAWRSAVKALRPQLFSTDIALTALVCPGSMFSKEKMTLFFYDAEEGANVRIVITHADMSVLKFIENVFDISSVRIEKASSVKDFNLTQDLIANGVYRATQFNLVVTGRKARYSWEHVQAAAHEFNFSPEQVVDLIVDAVHKGTTELSVSASVADEALPEKHRLAVVG